MGETADYHPDHDDDCPGTCDWCGWWLCIYAAECAMCDYWTQPDRAH